MPSLIMLPWTRTHHFVILNHFHHKSRISIPFYLLTSMNKAISSFKKKATVNRALHEGLLLLIHEHFRAQSIYKNPPQVEDVEKGSSNSSSNSNDIESISLEEENVTSGKKNKGQGRKQFTATTPIKKSPRDHDQAQEKESYAEEEEEMDTKDSDNESEEELEEEKPGKKWKREVPRVEETRN